MARPFRERLALQDELRISLLVFTDKCEPVGVLWPVAFNAAQYESESIALIFEGSCDVGASCVPQFVRHCVIPPV